MKNIILALNFVFDKIAIGVAYTPLVILYVLLSPVLFLVWVGECWQKAVNYASAS